MNTVCSTPAVLVLGVIAVLRPSTASAHFKFLNAKLPAAGKRWMRLPQNEFPKPAAPGPPPPGGRGN